MDFNFQIHFFIPLLKIGFGVVAIVVVAVIDVVADEDVAVGDVVFGKEIDDVTAQLDDSSRGFLGFTLSKPISLKILRAIIDA